MKTIGLIGGTSYESMTVYYRKINMRINQLLGGHHSAKLVLVNLDFEEIVPAFYENRWGDIEQILIKAVNQLERAGVDFIAICCNTLHKVAPVIKSVTHLPFLHIIDPIGQNIKQKRMNKIGLLGTKFTMNDSFYSNYLYDRFQVKTITPDEKYQEILNTIIFEELCHSILTEDSKKKFLKIANSLIQNQAQGIVLGCTELFMLVNPTDFTVPIFDTTALHTNAIVDYALQSNPKVERYIEKLQLSVN